MRGKVSKKTIICLIIALSLCFVSMFGSHMVQVAGGTQMYTFNGTLAELGDMIDANLAENGKEVDVTFERDAYKNLSFSVIIPKNATKDNPAPVIITTPGDSSPKENQMPNNVELARRGFVVLSMNYSGNMETDEINDLTNDTRGMTAVVEYAMSLDCTDNSKVGLVGHSYGNENCVTTINFFESETEHNHISAWLLEGTVDYAFPQSGWYEDKIMENPENLYLGIICSQYDEWDNWYDDAVNFLTGDLAKEAVLNFYPDYSDDAVSEGTWYAADGAHEYDPNSVNGEALGTGGGIAIWNPAINHNMTLTTNYGPDKVVTTMYAALGVPSGADYIDPADQVWGWGHVFTFLGVVGYFMLFFPAIELLLCIPVFQSLRRREEDIDDSKVPSLASWKELVPLILTTVALCAFALYNFPKMWAYGYNVAFNDTYNRPLANAAGYFTMWCGIATFVMIIVSYLLRKLFHRGDGLVIDNPFASLKVENATEFIKTIAYSLLVVVIMFIPVWIAYNVFQTDFRMNLILDRLQIVIDEPADYITFFVKYLPFWLAFYIPNAVINANTRYKKIPDWASTIWCVVMNAMGVLLYEVIQYRSVFTTGVFHWVGDQETWCGLCGVSMVLTISYAAFSARFAYKKTKSAWAGAIINAIIMGLLMFSTSGAISDLML